MRVNVFWAYLFVDNFAFHRASLSVTVRKSHFQLMNLKKNINPKNFEKFDIPVSTKMAVLAKNHQNLGQNWRIFRLKNMISMKRFSFKLIFFSLRPHTEVLFILEIFLKRKRRNNYAFVQTLLYKIRTEFTNINFIQCRLICVICDNMWHLILCHVSFSLPVQWQKGNIPTWPKNKVKIEGKGFFAYLF